MAHIIETPQLTICGICHLPILGGPVHQDHIIPRSYGGPNKAWNLRLTHGYCNLHRHNKIESFQLPLEAIGYTFGYRRPFRVYGHLRSCRRSKSKLIPVASNFIFRDGYDVPTYTVFRCSECGFPNEWEGDQCRCARHRGEALEEVRRCEACDEPLEDYADNYCEDCACCTCDPPEVSDGICGLCGREVLECGVA